MPYHFHLMNISFFLCYCFFMSQPRGIFYSRMNHYFQISFRESSIPHFSIFVCVRMLNKQPQDIRVEISILLGQRLSYLEGVVLIRELRSGSDSNVDIYRYLTSFYCDRSTLNFLKMQNIRDPKMCDTSGHQSFGRRLLGVAQTQFRQHGICLWETGAFQKRISEIDFGMVGA